MTATPAAKKIPNYEEFSQQAARRNPHRRLTTTDDVARAIVVLSPSRHLLDHRQRDRGRRRRRDRRADRPVPDVAGRHRPGHHRGRHRVPARSPPPGTCSWCENAGWAAAPVRSLQHRDPVRHGAGGAAWPSRAACAICSRASTSRRARRTSCKLALAFVDHRRGRARRQAPGLGLPKETAPMAWATLIGGVVILARGMVAARPRPPGAR